MAQHVKQISEYIDDLFVSAEQYKSSIHNKQYFQGAFNRTAESLYQVHGVRVPECEALAKQLYGNPPAAILKGSLVANAVMSKVGAQSSAIRKPLSDVPETPPRMVSRPGRKTWATWARRRTHF